MNISFSDCTTQVKTLVNEAMKSREGKTMWIVFDVDDTLLTDSHMRHEYKSRNDIFKAMYRGEHVGIIPMIELYNWCAALGLNMAIITGRVQSLQETTVENLKMVGLKKCHRLYFKPNNTNRGSNKVETAVYKAMCRKEILSDNPGHIILCNIGDQDTDFEGGYAEHHVKISSQ